MQFSSKIVPCLWFATEAEEAARYGNAGFETHGQKEGTALTVRTGMGKLDIAALERAYEGR